ncbi:DUF1684 domain-containing protein [Fulvivirga maritima]|uniref:DUF1684 domain-containing protein n=1 Tax=Fulvivirga maritima TaxID=2904247 RepID=UPI001F2C1F3B|nr:DUF1684 domain-containing protein [Fulvivirga maritima]UII27111.1 DUF1684 domain-containing protein [Fulvivirga maritima]
MSRNKGIIGAVVVVVIIIFIYSFQGQSPESYKAEIDKKREAQESFMRNSNESPFVEQNIKFEGLKFFPPDQKYKIKARFTPKENPEVRELATSEGEPEEYLEYGYATFTLDDKEQQLLIMENVQEGVLFLAFADETSAAETYGGGRYLELKHDGGKSILLDFNLAYNPYCAYTAGYSCPLPPKENLLTVAIRAGEKTYKDL